MTTLGIITNRIIWECHSFILIFLLSENSCMSFHLKIRKHQHLESSSYFHSDLVLVFQNQRNILISSVTTIRGLQPQGCSRKEIEIFPHDVFSSKMHIQFCICPLFYEDKKQWSLHILIYRCLGIYNHYLKLGNSQQSIFIILVPLNTLHWHSSSSEFSTNLSSGAFRTIQKQYLPWQ